VDADVPAPEPAPPEPRCPNCGTPASDQFCPRCGQPQTDYHRSLRSIVGDLLDTFAGWDAKIPRTLLLLVRRPGALTADYLAGRRARYVAPLRLYITLSVIFFLSLRVSPAELATSLGMREPAPPATTTARTLPLDLGQPRTARDSAELQAFLRRGPAAGQDTSTFGARFKRRFKHGALTVQSMSPEERKRAMRDGLVSRAGNLVFLLLPIFALLLRVLYLRSPFYYPEHIVFALHAHALAMFAFTAVRYSPDSRLTIALALWPVVYVYLAMRRVYGQSRRRTFAKFAVLGATYMTIASLTVIATILLSVLLLD